MRQHGKHEDVYERRLRSLRDVAELAAWAADEIEGYRRALVAHHDIATLSDKVLEEYDYRECPVCQRARESGNAVGFPNGETGTLEP